ncbi:lysozyme inhibitor LprI family protein [Pseudomonas sp. G.S.17]|uniref:lysozyme inhibitor LprI family protein n=1 Tax=Pseudomonas sp. G.S.17 TaxID=3137451 RepID=UPI00311CBB4B
MRTRFLLILPLFSFGICHAEVLLPRICAASNLSSQAIYECSEYNKKIADQDLNTAYKRLNDMISKDYKSMPSLGEKLKSTVKKSQLTWIKLRDENCAIEVFVIESGTQAFETTKNYCFAREGAERSRYLNDLRF